MGVVYYANYLVWFEVGRTDLLRDAGWTYREMEADGFPLPVIEAHCDYRQPARYDDELEMRTTGDAAVAGARAIRLRSRSAARIASSLATGHTVHASIDRDGRPCRLARPRPRGLARMKALVTGAAGFIGSTLCRAPARSEGADVVGIDCFTDYYPRALKERNLAALRGSRASGSSKRRSRTPICARCSTDRTHVFHLAAQAGVRKSWGRDFGVYTVNNIEATQVLLEACVGQPLERFVYASSSSVYGDDVEMPMRETALPQPVSPYGVTKLAAEQLCHLYYVNYGVPTVSLRYFTVYGPRQRPDMGFHRFFARRCSAEPITRLRRRRADPRFHVCGRRGRGDLAAAARGVPGRVYNIGGGSRVSFNRGLRPDCARLRPAAARRRRSGAEGRHAGHLRRHVAGEGRSGFAPTVRSKRAWRPSKLAGWNTVT